MDDPLLVELEVPELMLEEPDVNFDPEATSDADPAEDPDKITDTVAPWSDVTEDDPVFVELEDPALKEEDELRLEPPLKDDEETELRLEPPLKDDEETPELIEDTAAEVPVLALFDVPVMNEIEDPRLSLLMKPEWKHPAHKGPVPEVAIAPLVNGTVDPILAESVFTLVTKIVSIFFTFSTDVVSISFSTTMDENSSSDDVSTSPWITCVAGKRVFS